jgi:hypothetical protein
MPTRSYLKMIQLDSPYTASYAMDYNASNQSPDGLPNFELRSPQTVVMGVNSSNTVDSTSTNAILRGLGVTTMNPAMPPDFVTQTNFTIEQPLKGNSALRLTWLWIHGTNLDQQYFYNNHPSGYAWEMQTGTVPPTGTYSSVATGPFDKTTWGNNTYIQKSGWSNDNALQVNYQRLFHRGIAYQVSYVWSKPFRVGGNSFRDGQAAPYTTYAGSTGQVGTLLSQRSSHRVFLPLLPQVRRLGPGTTRWGSSRNTRSTAPFPCSTSPSTES